MSGPRSHGPGWTVVEVDDAQVEALSSTAGLSPVVSRLLVARGVTDPQAAARFLHPSLERDWRDPESLPSMGAAADAVARAVREGVRIVVFGDFDADGVSGAAVLHCGLRELGGDVTTIVPHRFREGYGLTADSLPRLLEARPELVVTVDCGVSSAETVAALRAQEIDVVVTDHHEPGESVPQDIPVVDPKLDPSYPFPELAGAGVGLKLVQAVGRRLGREEVFLDLTDLATIGTVGDIVPLRDENRALVAHGLERCRTRPRPALSALAEVAGVEVTSLTSENIAFALAPRLNAAGRMADPALALDLLISDDPDRARELASELHELNRVRQSAEKDLFDLAFSAAKEQVESGAPAVVVSGEGWHEGVRGIVASRLARKLGVPSIVFTLEDDQARGSGRSVPGVDLFAAVSSLSGLMERFGGHPMAVGATLNREDLDAFSTGLSEAVESAEREAVGVVIDGEIPLERVGSELAAEISLLEPFGEANRRPLFGARGVFMHERRRVGKGADHLLFEAFDGVASIPAAAFRCDEIEAAAGHDAAVDLAFEIEQDEWRGRSRTRLLVRELLRHEPLAGEQPASTLVEDLFEAAPAILARDAYVGIEDAESFHTKLAGVTFEGRQETLADLVAGVPLRLVRQPENPYDENACALFEPDGRQVGFFNRRLAAVLAPLLDDGLDLDVTVTDVTGGEEGRSLGVNVLVERRDLEGDPDAAILEARAALGSLTGDELDLAIRQGLIGDRPLREAQERSLALLSEGRGCLTVMATGRGKSLIFHLHAARLAISAGRASIFVYPLRALVSDQAFSLGESLGALGIGCETITGETSLGGRDEAFSRIADGLTDIVLTTPEFLDRHAGRFAQTGRVGFVVVDEAHHVGLARAGHRPAYARLGEALDVLGHPQVLAVTATASDEVAESIRGTLGVDEVVVDPSTRDNLAIEDRRGARDKLSYIASLASRGEKVITYVNSREKSIRLAQQLREKIPALRHRCAFYNGGVGRAQRHAIERAFRAGELTAVVATSAFGEGVDIPDIRHIIHYHLPFNEVEFNQMSGRGGRDGKPASVHLLYGPRDGRLNDLILESVAPERDDLAQLYLVLKSLQEEAEDGFEITNAELAEQVVDRRPRSKLTDRGVSAALGVFRELGLVDGEGAGSYRRLRVLPAPDGKVDLASSVRYAEGLRERQTFAEFMDWATGAEPTELLARFNRPILPTRYT